MTTVKGQIDKEGHVTTETIVAITVATTGGTTITHGLGVVPDTVDVNMTSQYACWCISTTATTIVLGSANASATCDVVIRVGSNPGTITETVS
jgi:hypothetical protein